jgi:cysteine desulfurase
MLNISILGTSTEYITLALDHRGFAVSTKSACREGEESFSHVILAQYGDKERAKSTLRISLGEGTQAKDVDHFVDELADVLKGPVQT